MKRRRSAVHGSLDTLSCVAILAFAGGCSVVTDPRAPVVVLPQAHSFGPCTRAWSPATPPAERTVVDLHFGTEGGGPSMGQILAVMAAGGIVVRRFNVPILRAEVDVDAVPSLVGGQDGLAQYAVTVPDPDRRPVVLIVMLSHDLTDADIAAVEELGGRILSRWESLDGYAVEIDDAQVPRVRSLPGVRSVSADDVGCLG